MTLLIGLLLLCQTEADARYREQCEAARPVFIKNAEARIEALLAIEGGRKDVIAAQVRRERKLIADLKSKKIDPTVLINLNKPVTGQFGITNGVGIVRQVVDAQNMLVELHWITTSGNALERLFWIERPTAGVVDGQDFETGGDLYEVIGTKTRNSRTVSHLKLFKSKP